MKNMYYKKEPKVFTLYIEEGEKWLSGFYSLPGEKLNYYVIGGEKDKTCTCYYDSDIVASQDEYIKVVKLLRTFDSFEDFNISLF